MTLPTDDGGQELDSNHKFRVVRAIVSGRVQGVAFRASMKVMADNEGIKGWVWNLPDGRVEALIQGDSANVENLLAWCRRGPPAAKVHSVVLEEVSSEGTNYRNFAVLP